MKSDIEIAQSIEMEKITKIAKIAKIDDKYLELIRFSRRFLENYLE